MLCFSNVIAKYIYDTSNLEVYTTQAWTYQLGGDLETGLLACTLFGDASLRFIRSLPLLEFKADDPSTMLPKWVVFKRICKGFEAFREELTDRPPEPRGARGSTLARFAKDL